VTTSKRVFREYQIESYCKQVAKKRGWWVSKFVSPSRRSMPDDIFIKQGRVFFVEFKATDGVVTANQAALHKELRDHGATVYVISDREEFMKVLDTEDFALEMAGG